MMDYAREPYPHKGSHRWHLDRYRDRFFALKREYRPTYGKPISWRGKLIRHPGKFHQKWEMPA